MLLSPSVLGEHKHSAGRYERKFYSVDGPKNGQAEEFFRRLNQIGGTPSGWRLYPHADHSGKALHLVDADLKE